MSNLLIDIRTEEFNLIRRFFQPGMNVLEIGGGNGYQASLIARTGAVVESIDVAEPPAGVETYFPVRTYDGQILPYPDQSFDIVFSSNVLEHISELKSMLSEVRRVVKSNGLAIHILPTPAWRFWTSLSHYVYGVKIILEIVKKRQAKLGTTAPSSFGAFVADKVRKRGFLYVVGRIIAAGPHGEYPSALSELWYFSRRRWLRLFQDSGYDLVEDWPSGIFYTGYGVFPSISIHRRRELARILGSATHVFLLRRTP